MLPRHNTLDSLERDFFPPGTIHIRQMLGYRFGVFDRGTGFQYVAGGACVFAAAMP